MDLRLKDKNAFVSGSTAGIGYAIAKRLLDEGAKVVINGRSQKSVDSAVEKLAAETGSQNVSGIAGDLSTEAGANEVIGSISDLDILINNAGIFEPRPFAEITDEDWIRFFEVNVMSGVRLARHFFPKMIEKNWGRIIFISSESGVFIPSEMIHYGVTKTAQLAVSRGLAELTRGTNVTVNSILPGPTKSEGVKGFIDDLSRTTGRSLEEVESDFFKNERPTSLINRFATVQEVADTVVYYASPLASATNGAAIRVEGGLVKSVI